MVKLIYFSMADSDRPPPSFIALRAASLGVDDISRQALRGWLFNGVDHRGEVVPDHPPPTEPATVVIIAGLLQLDQRSRMRFRQWLGKWTDYTGRIITPSEQRQRLDALSGKVARRQKDVAMARNEELGTLHWLKRSKYLSTESADYQKR